MAKNLKKIGECGQQILGAVWASSRMDMDGDNWSVLNRAYTLGNRHRDNIHNLPPVGGIA